MKAKIIEMHELDQEVLVIYKIYGGLKMRVCLPLRDALDLRIGLVVNVDSEGCIC